MAFAIMGHIGTIAPIAVGGIGIFVALRNQHRQLHAQMFIEFSGRFQELLRLFPTDAWIANRSPSQPLPPPSPELTDSVLYALQFIADVYHLHQGGFVSKKLWRLWERAIHKTLAGRVFQREWIALSEEFTHSREFVFYINAVMSGNCRRCKQMQPGGRSFRS